MGVERGSVFMAQRECECCVLPPDGHGKRRGKGAGGPPQLVRAAVNEQQPDARQLALACSGVQWRAELGVGR